MAITESVLAAVVLRYLEANQWTKSVKAFKSDAKNLLVRAKGRESPFGTKSLAELLAEHLQMTLKDAQRAALQRSNPLAQSLFNVLDCHAAASSVPPVFNYAAPAPPPGGPTFPQMMHPWRATDLAEPILSQGPSAVLQRGPPRPLDIGIMADANLGLQREPQAGGRGPQGTPGRHAQRKNAPSKRRRLDLDFEAARPVSPPSADPQEGHDLLHRPLRPEALRDLMLDDEEVERFGALMASRINQQTEMMRQDMDDLEPGLFVDDPELADFVMRLVEPADHLHGAAALLGGTESLPPPEQPAAQQQQQQQQVEQPQNFSNPPLQHGNPPDEERPEKENTIAEGQNKEKGRRQAQLENGSGGKVAVDEEIAHFMARPDELEDLINECIG